MSLVKDYLSFSKRERNAFIVLVVIIGGFIFLPDLFRRKKPSAPIDASLKKEIASSAASPGYDSSNDDKSWETPFADPKQKVEIRLFAFDPNTLDEQGFVSLGLTAKTARIIINYRSKGGQFRKPDDIRKIYSLKKEDADRIVPFIRINGNASGDKYYSNGNKNSYKQKPAVTSIDINTATVEEWKSLRGIGDILSVRIVKFRERLGGFSSIEQVSKTWGLKDSTFQLIKPFLKLSSPAINRININTATENELMECSAVSKEVAQAIVIFRKQKGRFEKLEDLKKIVFINEEMYQNIRSCLKAE